MSLSPRLLYFQKKAGKNKQPAVLPTDSVDLVTKTKELMARWSAVNTIIVAVTGRRIMTTKGGTYGSISLEDAEKLAQSLNSKFGDNRRIADEI